MLEHIPVAESGTGMTFNDGRLDFAGIQFPTRLGSFGFGLIQFAIGGIEGRQTLADQATTINATQTALFLPYGFNVGRYSFGITGKMVNYSSVSTAAPAMDSIWAPRPAVPRGHHPRPGHHCYWRDCHPQRHPAYPHPLPGHHFP